MSAIKERPILFAAPTVRAILEGRKTVTRREIKPSKRSADTQFELHQQPDGSWLPLHTFDESCMDDKGTEHPIVCPYGKPGDRLWVRETCLINDFRDGGVPEAERADCQIIYRADGTPDWEGEEELIRWRPSIHMPRWASRILLEITDVRVERLQDITEDQARVEGCFFTDYGQACFHGGRGIRDATECEYPASKHQQRPGWMWDKTKSYEQCLDSARHAFGNLWNSVGGDWGANPWVWVVEFKQVTP